jgi:hypothetical protein
MSTKKQHLKINTTPVNGVPLIFGLDYDQTLRLKLVPHLHLARLLAGVGTYEGWNLLALRCNVGQYIANKHFKEVEARHCLAQGLRALVLIHQRFQTNDRVTIDAGEATLIGAALCLTDDMQDRCSRREWSDATMRVYEIAGV